MFTTDRDLLQYEPQLFNDVRWAGQTLLTHTGAALNAAGDAVTMAGVPLAARGVGVGSVVLLSGLAVEVLALPASDAITVSLVRAKKGDAPIPVPGGPRSVDVIIATFRPQIALVHDRILRSLGIEPDDPTPGALTESAILNPGALSRVEALGALHTIFATSAALVDEHSPMWAKAVMYRDRFIEERRRVRVDIDLNADGEADATRTIDTMRFVRF